MQPCPAKPAIDAVSHDHESKEGSTEKFDENRSANNDNVDALSVNEIEVCALNRFRGF
jgi:hypothetical protein